MVHDIQIDKAEKNDVADIARIAYQIAKMHDENVPEYFRPVSEANQLKNIQEMLDDERIIVFKAVYEGSISGFLFLEINHRVSSGLKFTKVGLILNFAVDETCRNKGIGAKLLKSAEEFCLHQGCEALDLSVFFFNQRAIKFYEKQGYSILDVSMRKVL